ncbi:YjgN family protein [Marinobacter xestospongiae]|uniref:YjgN family protein n=1 Tax=Marinobacter xestospongiae TaxID=994319 RepID=UPI0020067588|nr:YjgN family protein [Marinobacter xestospongiae]MCK7568982.1 DUF898 domain-containing protein [Marinobacter xestospongiae]
MTTDSPQPSSSTPPPAAAQSTAIPREEIPRNEPVLFSGQAGEFFGIWFVNNILTWMTLGIYSAWAKVRTLQYFYGNTEVAGGRFAFTAKPLQILKSRIIAFGLLVIFLFAENSPATWALYLYLGFVVTYLVLAPVLTVLVMSFQLRYSAWRGIPFRFNKDYRGAYRVYLPPLLLMLLVGGSVMAPFFQDEIAAAFSGDTAPVGVAQESDWVGPDLPKNKDGQLKSEPGMSCDEYHPNKVPTKCAGEAGVGEQAFENLTPYQFIPAAIFMLLLLLGLPYFDFINQRFLARNIRFGVAEVTYTGQARDYYRIYWLWLLASALLVTAWIANAAWGAGNAGFIALVIATILYFPLTKAYLKSRRYNLLFGKCSIDNGKFQLKADVPFLRLAFVLITNTLAVTFTFGLMTAWAKVRTARVILDSMSLDVNAPMDQFLAAQEEKQSALAEEMADVFDIDVAF